MRFREPFNWNALLAFLGARAIPGVEQVEGGTYRRTVRIGRRTGAIAVAREAKRLRVTMSATLEPVRDAIEDRVTRVFGIDADVKPIERALARDPLLAPIIRRHSGLRIPGAWDPFELAVRAILGQQVTVAGATTLVGRVVTRAGLFLDCGGEAAAFFPTPAELLRADLTSLGAPTRRIETLRALARANIAFTRDELLAIPGIGPWTASYVALRALQDADAFPEGDIALRKAASDNGAPLSAKALLARAEAWAPWRGYAVLYLWHKNR